MPICTILILLFAAAPGVHARQVADPLKRILDLSEKWQETALTADEKDELLRDLTRHLLSQEGTPPVDSGEDSAAQTSGIKIIAAYIDRNTTKLVLESHTPLVSGSFVYGGEKEVPITLDDLLSRSGDLYYYSASTPGRQRLGDRDRVVTSRSRRIETPSVLRLKIEESYNFEEKRYGEVTAVQEGRAMIDRGTLHRVRERDVYRVFDDSGSFKGLLEIGGIGDLQSSGTLYNRFLDRKRRVSTTEPGDRVVFAGQRKLFALGLMGATSLSPSGVLSATESIYGGGLAWDIMFRDGWGFEIVFGANQKILSANRETETIVPIATRHIDRQRVESRIVHFAPLVLKKNLFFPAVVSPFLVAGGSVYRATLSYSRVFVVQGGPGQTTTFNYEDSRVGFSPIFGGGLDFFPARLIRPRIDARWYAGPKLKAGHITMPTQTLYLSMSIFTAW